MKKTLRLIMFVSVFIVSIAFSMPALALPDNSVFSQHITEADGTSGQDTNSGSGIKTGHIQDSAVTNAKIADGAVTDAKIAGPISASKISKYPNIIVVAKSEGDFTDPVTAMSSITDASATNPYLVKIMPGVYDISTATLLMKEYVDIEGSGENVTIIKGNPELLVWGANNSEIRFLSLEQYGAPPSYGAALYARELADSFRVSHVSILIYGAPNTHAIYAFTSSLTLTDVTATAAGTYDNITFLVSSSTPVMKNVRLQAYGGTHRNCGLKTQYATDATISNVTIVADRGIENERSSSVKIANVSIKALTDWGIYNIDSSTTVSNSVIEAQNGLFNLYQSMPTDLTVDHSTIKATATAASSNAAINIGQTKLDGTLSGSGVYNCYGVYNSSYQAVLCP